jgi:hypothetical protein
MAPLTNLAKVHDMRITYDPDLYNLSDGRFIAKFVRVIPHTSSKPDPKTGQIYPPGLKWEFELCSGEDTGKPASCITGERPTKKNSCLRIMSGIVGHPLDEQEAVDTDQYVGKFYMVTITDGGLSHQFPPQFVGASLVQAVRTYETLTGKELPPPPSQEPLPY